MTYVGTILVGGLRLHGRRDAAFRAAENLWAGGLVGAGIAGGHPSLIGQAMILAAIEVACVFILLR